MRASIIILALFITNSAVFAQKGQIKSAWSTHLVKVDGNDNEWEKPFPFFDEKSGMHYAIVNDDKKMCFCFRSSDPVTQVKMIREGMTLTLSTEGKSKREAAVNFPLEALSDPLSSGSGPRQRFDKQQMRNQFLATSTFMGTSGFADHNGMISVRDSSGLNASVNWDSSEVLVYELSIPLAAFYGNNYSAQDLLSPLTLGVEIHPLEQPKQHADDEDSGDSEGEGMGRPGGGMGRGGYGGGGHHRGGYGGGQNQSNRTALFEKTAFKHKLTLATRP